MKKQISVKVAYNPHEVKDLGSIPLSAIKQPKHICPVCKLKFKYTRSYLDHLRRCQSMVISKWK
jgi:queuine/archaeosine tRNA-ribosyltransferase